MDQFVERRYRRLHGGDGLAFYRVVEGQSDLSVGTPRPRPDLARQLLKQARIQVEAAIAACPAFLTSMAPLDPALALGQVDGWMLRAGQAAGVGPMAAVAGAIARYVGETLALRLGEAVVENGGDLYLKSAAQRIVAVYAGASPLSGRVGIVLPPGEWGVCTSAGRVGPSISLGRADAAVVLSRDSALADAAATALGNRIRREEDLSAAVDWALQVPGVLGALAVQGQQMAAGGAVELTALAVKGGLQ